MGMVRMRGDGECREKRRVTQRQRARWGEGTTGVLAFDL